MHDQPIPLFEITSGWTGILGPFTLALDGVPYNLSSAQEIKLILRRGSGEAFDGAGVITQMNQGTDPGKVTYAPVDTDFVWQANLNTFEQIYTLHWRVRDNTGKYIFFPNGEAERVLVHRA